MNNFVIKKNNIQCPQCPKIVEIILFNKCEFIVSEVDGIDLRQVLGIFDRGWYVLKSVTAQIPEIKKYHNFNCTKLSLL